MKKYFSTAKSYIEQHRVLARSISVFFIAIMILSLVSEFGGLLVSQKQYDLSDKAQELVPEPIPTYADKLKFDTKAQTYVFNEGYSATSDTSTGETSAPKFSANFYSDPAKGVQVQDVVNKTSMTFKPTFSMYQPQKDQNRMIYPLKGKDGVKVYTLKANGFKEDIILNSPQGDTQTFSYDMELPDGVEARIESDGSLGVYGPSQMLLGEVSTGTEQDSKLLQQARKNADKTTLLFRSPAPFIVEFDKKTTKAKARFMLENNMLSIVAEGLDSASYPLSIDPSVYVETAQKLMRGNNETNINFDVDNELIQKGSTTGARFDNLLPTTSLPATRWNHGTAVAAGYVYAVGGNNGTANQSTVYWARFNTTSKTIDAPNPGNGVCTNWCTNSAYNLPAARAGLSLVAYNGFLYAFGGLDGSNNRTNTVYIAKIGVNGEPSLWHPSDTNPNNWTYWYADTTLTSARSYTAAVAYNNRMYIMGGNTAASPTGINTVEYANIRPTGTLDGWKTSGMSVLPTVRYGHSLQVYNDNLYLIGGTDGSTSTQMDTVDYVKINSDGTFRSSWISGTGFNVGRSSLGGNFTAVWGGYLYIMSGCSAINASGYCTTIRGDTQVVSINADGSIAQWANVGNIVNPRMGAGLVSWRDTLYSIGGCTTQNTTSGACTVPTVTTQYARINQDGDASTVGDSFPSGTAPCSGSDPHTCNLPPAGDNAGQSGQMSSGVVINNGFIYIIGGCASISGTSECASAPAMSGNITYAALAYDGTIVSPATCPGTLVGTWCVDSTNKINSPVGNVNAGIGTNSATVFNNVIYSVGGTDGANWNANIYRVGLNVDGSLAGAWQAQTFATLGMGAARGYSYSFTRANPTSAGTYPGNLYVLGGCNQGTTGDGIGCTTYFSDVYKCNIMTDGSLETADANDCTTAGQLQLDAEPAAGVQGIGLMAGALYANYIYLVGGSTSAQPERGEVMYAKLDANNNIVAAEGSEWVTSPNQMNPIRRRGFAFGYNGYLYSLAGYATNTNSLNDLLFSKIDVSTGSIGPFKTSTVTVTFRWDLRAIVSNGYVYAIGGCNTGTAPSGCTAMEGSVQTFQLYNNNSGGPAGYSSSPSLFGTDRYGASAAVRDGYIYIAGGCTSNDDCTNAISSVEYAQLNADGSVGTWAATTGLPADRAYGQMELAGNTLYYVGGQDDAGTAQATVYYANHSGGAISSWSTATNGLPAGRAHHGGTVWNNRLYMTGGVNGGNTQNTVYVSPQLSGGNISSAWSSTTNFNVARSGHTSIAYANNLYTLGGFDGTNYLNDVQFTQINSDGSIDGWTDTTSLPQRIRNADGYAANGYMYLFGGRSSEDTCTNNTYVTPISANTTIATGNNPTGIGDWFVTNERFASPRYAAAAAYNEGKAYVLGGGCKGLATGSSVDVLEDDFDPSRDVADWSSVTSMDNGTNCGTIGTGNSLVSTGGGSASAVTINTDVRYGGSVNFRLRIPTNDTATCDPPESGEDLQLQYSNNNGAGWTTIATYDESNFNTSTDISENIPQAAQTAGTRFRWIMPLADGGDDEWAIDNVVVKANTAAPSSQIMEDNFDPSIDAVDWTSTTGMSVGTNCGTIASGNSIVSTGGTSSAQTVDFNMPLGGTVTFDLFIPTSDINGNCTQPDAGEDLLLQYSTNNGGNWTTMATYDESNYATTTTVSALLPSGANSSSTRFRWIITNGDNGTDEWALDNIIISATDPPVILKSAAHRLTLSTLQAQPQVAKYSRMIDTDTDVFPTKWLMNGIDNSIGARWNMLYRSSTNATASWGQDTNFGSVTLGQPENYIPKDSGGSNTNFARYYYMSISIDSSQAYGYPDDVTRGPTVNDITLFFTSDPSRRLRHGKTFTGGELQPLDTPFP